MTYHCLLQAFEILSGLFPSVLHHPINIIHHEQLFPHTTQISSCLVCVIHEFVQFAALLLVSGSEFLVLHLQALLFQHDLLVLTADKKQSEKN